MEEDMIRFLQQHMGRRARISAVASRLLTEEGEAARPAPAHRSAGAGRVPAEGARGDRPAAQVEQEVARGGRRPRRLGPGGAVGALPELRRARRGRADVPADGAGARAGARLGARGRAPRRARARGRRRRRRRGRVRDAGGGRARALRSAQQDAAHAGVRSVRRRRRGDRRGAERQRPRAGAHGHDGGGPAATAALQPERWGRRAGRQRQPRRRAARAGAARREHRDRRGPASRRAVRAGARLPRAPPAAGLGAPRHARCAWARRDRRPGLWLPQAPGRRESAEAAEQAPVPT